MKIQDDWEGWKKALCYTFTDRNGKCCIYAISDENKLVCLDKWMKDHAIYRKVKVWLALNEIDYDVRYCDKPDWSVTA